MNKRSGNILISLLIGLILLSVAAASYLYLQNKNSKSITVSNLPQVEVSSSNSKITDLEKSGFAISPSATNNGWQTYSHQIGFSFDFPIGEKYEFENRPVSSPNELLYLRIYTNTDTLGKPMPAGPFIDIIVYPGSEPLDNSVGTLDGDPKEKVINDIKFQEYTVLGMGNPHGFRTIRNNITYDFSEIFGPLPELDKLIRSVKF